MTKEALNLACTLKHTSLVLMAICSSSVYFYLYIEHRCCSIMMLSFIYYLIII